MSIRHQAIGFAGAALFLAGADVLACRFLQYRMRTAYTDWVATITSQGWSVRHERVKQGGFPFGANLTITGLDLSGGRAMLPGGLDWRADRIVLSLGLLRFWRLSVEPQGQQVIRVANTKPVTCFADSLVAYVPLGRGRANSIDLDANGLTAASLGAGERQEIRIEHLALRLEAQVQGAARITAEADIDASGVELPDNGRWPLGALMKRAAAQISLKSPALSGADAADQARAWRNWGGAVAVQNLRLLWGPLDLHASAHMGLDESLQPAGEGTASIKGWAQTVDALAAGGVMADGMAQTVKMVMGLMAKAPEAPGDDGQSALTVPFKLKDNTLSVGKIPLVRLRDIDWNAV